MKALIYYGIKDVRVEDREIPVCGPNDAIVRVVRAGICGSDTTAYLHGGENMYIFSGREFGHEMTGYIYQLGENVAGMQEGDRVFVEPSKAVLDPYEANMAGAFSQYVLVHNACCGANIFRLPDCISYDEAVLIEPLSVSTHAKNRAQVKAGEKVLVCGCGPIGLGVIAALKAQGNEKVAVVDRDAHRLKYAEKMGAHPILSNSNNLEDLKDQLTAYFGTMQNINHRVQFGTEGVKIQENRVLDADVVFDCAGMPGFVDEFLLHAKQCARFCDIAVHRAPVSIRFHEIMSTQCALMGSRGYEREDILEVIDFLERGQTKAGMMVSHCIPLEQASQAFELAADPASCTKVVINME